MNMSSEEIIQSLLNYGVNQLKSVPQANQMIILYTNKNNTFILPVEDFQNTEPEKALLQKLRAADDTQLMLLVCIWRNGYSIDLPALNFRKALVALDVRNKDTLIPLLSSDSDGNPCIDLVLLKDTIGK